MERNGQQVAGLPDTKRQHKEQPAPEDEKPAEIERGQQLNIQRYSPQREQPKCTFGGKRLHVPEGQDDAHGRDSEQPDRLQLQIIRLRELRVVEGEHRACHEGKPAEAEHLKQKSEGGKKIQEVKDHKDDGECGEDVEADRAHQRIRRHEEQQRVGVPERPPEVFADIGCLSGFSPLLERDRSRTRTDAGAAAKSPTPRPRQDQARAGAASVVEDRSWAQVPGACFTSWGADAKRCKSAE
jgi:hypothetical protein